MCSGPYFDRRSGAYSYQWFDGTKWTRTQVLKIPGWKPGSPRPKKDPPEVTAMKLEFFNREKAARGRKAIDPSKTIRDFLAEFQAAHALDVADGTTAQFGFAIKPFLAWCDAAKIVKVNDLTTAACQRYLDKRSTDRSKTTGKVIGPGTVNQQRGLIAGAWSRSVRLKEIDANPWTGAVAPGWGKAKRAKVHRASWTPEQFAKLHAVCPTWLKDVLTLGTQTGLRINAIRHVKWTDVTLHRSGPYFGILKVPPKIDKNGFGYEVPLSEAMYNLFIRRHTIHSDLSPYIVTAFVGGQIHPKVTYNRIKAACVKAGLPDPSSPNHHMRRTFGRWAVLGHLIPGQPVPLYVVMKWLGHTNVNTTMRYLDLGEEDSQKWMTGQGKPDHDLPDPDGKASTGQ